MSTVLSHAVAILNDMAIFLLFGFLFAGMLHALFQRREGLIAPLLKPGARPIFLAALLGAPMPLCSCGVIPTAVSLRKRGAGKGTVASFLISCPETDVVSIILTLGLIGPWLAVIRPISAILAGFATGLMVDLVERWRRRRAATPEEPRSVRPVDLREALQCSQHGTECFLIFRALVWVRRKGEVFIHQFSAT